MSSPMPPYRVRARLLLIAAIQVFRLALYAQTADVYGINGQTTRTSQQAGTNIAVRITAAYSSSTCLASGCTILVDEATGGSFGSDPFAGMTKQVHVIMGSGSYSITANLAIPANVTLTFLQGARFNVSRGVTVTVSSPIQAPQRSKLFTGSGTVNLTANDAIYPFWYGAVGDGVTDDGPAINVCLAANPGRRILFPATKAAVSGGAASTNWGYYSSVTLVMAGNGQVLEGIGPSLWNAPVGIKFAPGVAGVRIPMTCFGCGVRNLGLYGQLYWNRADLTTYPAWTTATIVGNGPDGIQALGAYPVIENVDVEGFGRHGIFLDGGSSIQSSSQPDGWQITNAVIAGNRGYGIFAYDGDANTGSARNVNSRFNLLAGIYDRSNYGNVWLMPESTYDGNAGLAAGATQAVSSVSASSGVCTLTTNSVLANGVGMVGTWVTLSGTSGGSTFGGTFKVASVDSGARQITYRCSASGGPASGGAVGTASGASVFAALIGQAGSPGIVHGSYITGSGAAVWINPYCEGTTFSPNFNTGTVIGGNCNSTIVNSHWNYAGLMNNSGTPRFIGGGLDLWNYNQNTPTYLTFWGGNSTDQYEVIRFLDHNQNNKFSFGSAPGTEFFLKDISSAIFPIDYFSNTLHLASQGSNPLVLNRASGGAVQSMGGGTSPVWQVDAAGDSYFAMNSAGNNYGRLTGTFTKARTFTFQDVSGTVPLTIASGTSALGNAAIDSGACAAVVATPATNALTTDSVLWAFASVPTASDGQLSYTWYVTADHVNWRVCNPTTRVLTPSGLSVNWRVLR